MSVQYDPSIIRGFASQLYRRANLIILGWAVFGALAGFVLTAILASRTFGVIGSVAGLILGVIIGAGIAFQYKLQAQLALCLVQIEENTRRLRREGGV